MKRIFKITPVALAVAAVFASPVQASENGNGYQHGPYSLTNKASVDLDTEWDIRNDVTVWGGALVLGVIPVHAESAAVVDGKQLNFKNSVENHHNTNNAVGDGNALQGASGNIGLNITAGSNNQQANEAALSAVDADFVFASAQNFALQSAAYNPTTNLGVLNNAFLTGNALQNASGNIGANVAAGSSNQQRNELSASVNTGGSMAKASSWGVQESYSNTVNNQPTKDVISNSVTMVLGGGMVGGYAGGGVGGYQGGGHGGYSGGGSGGYSGSASGNTSGMSYQASNFYPDIWTNPAGTNPHGAHGSGNTSPYHFDMDYQTQGAIQNPTRNGVGGMAFDDRGTYSGTESGSIGFREGGSISFQEGGHLGFVEAGGVAMAGTFSGNVVFLQTIYRDTVNNAVLNGNALQGASGNIGVNIAAGSTNQQRNSLAIAAGLGRSNGGPE